MMHLPLFIVMSLTAAPTDSLQAAIAERISQVPSAVVAVSYRDLESGETFALNGDTVFHAASTMKIPVMIEVLRRAQQGAFSLDQQLLLVNEFASLADRSSFKLDSVDDDDKELYLHVGERVAIRNLIRRMITKSSNFATNVLIELVGAREVTQGAMELGTKKLRVLRGVEDLKAFDRGMINTTTSADLAILLAAIESGSALSKESSSEMREILLGQEDNSKIPAGLPPGTRVAHKTGEITAVSHDAAIVYRPGSKPYILVVLTRGMREPATSAGMIADISRLVWNHTAGTNK